jgi:hypothetical protein
MLELVPTPPLFVSLKAAQALFSPPCSMTFLRKALSDRGLRYHMIGARPYVLVRDLVELVERQPATRGGQAHAT